MKNVLMRVDTSGVKRDCAAQPQANPYDSMKRKPMKRSVALLLAVVGVICFCQNVMAQVTPALPPAPNLQTELQSQTPVTILASGAAYYLYNIGAGGYLTSKKVTQHESEASVQSVPDAYSRLSFTQEPDGTWRIKTPRFPFATQFMFRDGTTQNVYMDSNDAYGKGDPSKWNITSLTSGKFRLASFTKKGANDLAADDAKEYAAPNGLSPARIYTDIKELSTPSYLDWEFYDALPFDMKSELYEWISIAYELLSKEPIADLQTAYENAISMYNAGNTENIINAITTINGAISAHMIAIGQYIYNPSFDTGIQGWTSTKEHGYGFTAVEIFQKGAADFSQKIIGLPSGFYKLTAQAFYRNDGGSNAYMYAGSEEKQINLLTGAENNMQKAENAFLANKYPMEILFNHPQQGDLKIGVKNIDNLKTWIMFDMFGLIRYESIQDYYAPEAVAILDENKPMNSVVKTRLTNAVNVNWATLSGDALTAAVNELTAAVAAARASIIVYSSLEEAIIAAEGSDVANIEVVIAAINAAQTAYNNGLADENSIYNLKYAIGTARENFITNTRLSGAFTEVWNGSHAASADEKETLVLLAGKYTLVGNAFQRRYQQGNTQAGIDRYRNGTEEIAAFLYVTPTGGTAIQQPIKSIYSKLGTLTGADQLLGFSNAGSTATAEFEAGNYFNILNFELTEPTEVTVGLRITSGNWNTFGNFRLFKSDEMSFTLNDNEQFVSPALGATMGEIKYVRNFPDKTVNEETNNGWQSICLPFNVTSIKLGDTELIPGINCWLFEAQENAYIAASEIEANTCYLMALPNDPAYYISDFCLSGDVTFSGTELAPKPTFADINVNNNYSMTASYEGAYTNAVMNDTYGIFDMMDGENEVSCFKKGQYNGTFWAFANAKVGASSNAFSVFGNTLTHNRNLFSDGVKSISVSVVESGIEISVEKSRYIRIHTLEGLLVKAFQIPSGTTRIELPAGVYIVAGQKIIVNE